MIGFLSKLWNSPLSKKENILTTVLTVYVFACVLILIIHFCIPTKAQTRPCVIHEPPEEGPLYLVCTSTGTVDTVDAYGQERLMGKREEYGFSTMGGGYDEASGCSYSIFQMPDDAVSWVHINNGNTIMAIQGVGDCFCEECAKKIKEAISWSQRHTYVLYDAVAEEFHPISLGKQNISNYIVETTKEEGGYSMVVTTLE